MDPQTPAGATVPPPTWLPPAAPPPPPPPPVQRRRRNTRLVAIAVAAALVAGAAVGVTLGVLTRPGPATSSGASSPSSSPTSATAAQARTLYRQSLQAMRSSSGFHYVSKSTGGTSTQTIVGDAGQKGGRQVITVDSSSGTEQFTLILVDGIVYFQGNVPALQDQLGVPAATAAGLPGKWVSVAQADGPYGVVAPGITADDQAGETALVPAATLPITTGGGTAATRITGTVPPQQGAPGGTGHLDVATSSHLPIAYGSTLSEGGVSLVNVTTFSAWGTAVAPTAPSGAVAWSTLGASAPPGGYGSGGGGGAASPAAAARRAHRRRRGEPIGGGAASPSATPQI